jgi:hypothetical protein
MAAVGCPCRKNLQGLLRRPGSPQNALTVSRDTCRRICSFACRQHRSHGYHANSCMPSACRIGELVDWLVDASAGRALEPDEQCCGAASVHFENSSAESRRYGLPAP